MSDYKERQKAAKRRSVRVYRPDPKQAGVPFRFAGGEQLYVCDENGTMYRYDTWLKKGPKNGGAK